MIKKLNAVLVLSLLIMSIVTVNAENLTQNKNANYRVEDLALKSVPLEFENYAEAEKALASGSNSSVIRNKDGKILAAQPNQAYVYVKSSGTYNIYGNQSLTNAITYVTGYYKMFYYGTKQVGNKLVAEVEIQGARGYVDANSLEFLPFSNGGFRDDYYQVSNGEISYYYYKQDGTADGLTYGASPSWLTDGKYYSPDGIKFYKDRELKVPIKDGNKTGEFYAYYQWLPVRTLSNITGQDIHNHLSNIGYLESSVITNNEQAFIENGNKYGMNALLLYSQAALESAYGSSGYAKERYNLFGWNAFDSNPNLASSYAGVDSSIKRQMGSNLAGYFNISDWRNEGLSFGNKGSGIAVRYASDPLYGIKIASIAYRFDKSLKFKDHNAYNLTKIADKQDLNMRSKPQLGNNILYTHPSDRINQIRTQLSNENGFIKSNVAMNQLDGKIYESVNAKQVPLNLLNNFEYFSSDYATLQNKHGSTNGKLVTKIVTVSDELKYFRVDTSSVKGVPLSMRSGWSTDFNWLDEIPNGKIISGYRTTNGWVKVSYAGITGYVSGEYLEETSKPNPNEKIKLGDVNNDGKITVRDMMMIHRDLTNKSKLNKEEFKRADVNKDGKLTVRDMMMIHRHITNKELIGE